MTSLVSQRPSCVSQRFWCFRHTKSPCSHFCLFVQKRGIPKKGQNSHCKTGLDFFLTKFLLVLEVGKLERKVPMRGKHRVLIDQRTCQTFVAVQSQGVRVFSLIYKKSLFIFLLMCAELSGGVLDCNQVIRLNAYRIMC